MEQEEEEAREHVYKIMKELNADIEFFKWDLSRSQERIPDIKESIELQESLIEDCGSSYQSSRIEKSICTTARILIKSYKEELKHHEKNIVIKDIKIQELKQEIKEWNEYLEM